MSEEKSQYEPTRQNNGTFGAGNPGKPQGAVNKTTKAVDQMLGGQVETITQAAIGAALSGDSAALRLCLERLAPAPKDRAIQMDMPKVSSAADLTEAMSAIVQAVANGEATPSEAQKLSSIIADAGRAIELRELEARLDALEQ